MQTAFGFGVEGAIEILLNICRLQKNFIWFLINKYNERDLIEKLITPRDFLVSLFPFINIQYPIVSLNNWYICIFCSILSLCGGLRLNRKINDKCYCLQSSIPI